jgi:Pretoxin HINT domain
VALADLLQTYEIAQANSAAQAIVTLETNDPANLFAQEAADKAQAELVQQLAQATAKHTQSLANTLAEKTSRVQSAESQYFHDLTTFDDAIESWITSELASVERDTSRAEILNSWSKEATAGSPNIPTAPTFDLTNYNNPDGTVELPDVLWAEAGNPPNVPNHPEGPNAKSPPLAFTPFWELPKALQRSSDYQAPSQSDRWNVGHPLFFTPMGSLPGARNPSYSPGPYWGGTVAAPHRSAAHEPVESSSWYDSSSQFLSNYAYYFWRPSEMDESLQTTRNVALTTSAVALTAAGGVVVYSAYSGTAYVAGGVTLVTTSSTGGTVTLAGQALIGAGTTGTLSAAIAYFKGEKDIGGAALKGIIVGALTGPISSIIPGGTSTTIILNGTLGGASEQFLDSAMSGNSFSQVLKDTFWGGILGGGTAGVLDGFARKFADIFNVSPAKAADVIDDVVPNNVLPMLQDTCFAAGTPVLTPDGSKLIEDFEVGDAILSRNEHDPFAPLEVQYVERLFRLTAPIVLLTVNGRTIRTTAKHPFYVEGEGWKPTVALQVGDLLVAHDRQIHAVERVETTEQEKPVYNLRVSNHHTYFVGSAEWGFSVWVHNRYYVEMFKEITNGVTVTKYKVVEKLVDVDGRTIERVDFVYDNWVEASDAAVNANKKLSGAVTANSGRPLLANPNTTLTNPIHLEVDSLGRPIRAEGILVGSHPGRGKGYRPEPNGGRLPGDHRGHLVPENGVANPKDVNVKGNIIAEAARSNLSAKKSLEYEAIALADANKGSVVRFISEPKYHGMARRPYEVVHTITMDGKVVKSATISNE